VERIVILTRQANQECGLLALVTTLFPDCQVDVLCEEVETFEKPAVTQNKKLRLHQRGGDDGKDSHRR
jgi:hypothetical protein